MKNKVKYLLTILICCFAFSLTIYANVNKKTDFSAREDSILLPENIKSSSGYGNTSRGNYISTSVLTISNKGYGEIGIYASTAAHKPVEKIRMNIYLDRWDENKEKWVQVDYYYFTYEYEEGGEELTSVSEAFSVLGLPTGCYYRLRSFNAVFPFEGGVESQGPVTDGVLITNGPAV